VRLAEDRSFHGRGGPPEKKTRGRNKFLKIFSARPGELFTKVLKRVIQKEGNPVGKGERKAPKDRDVSGK